MMKGFLKKYKIIHLYYHNETILAECYMTDKQFKEAWDTLDEMGTLRDGVYDVVEIEDI